MEVRYNQFTGQYEIIHQGRVLATSEKGQFKNQKEAAVWFKQVAQQILTMWSTQGEAIQ